MLKRKFNPTKRYIAFMDPACLQDVGAWRGAWYESPEEIRTGFALDRRKTEALLWVREQMATNLTDRERRCIELHYFMGKTFECMGRMTGTTASSCFRAVQRGIVKLRRLARRQKLKNPFVTQPGDGAVDDAE